MNLVRSKELCDRAGCSFRVLDYWSRVGLIRPARGSGGSGNVRLWDGTAIRVARVLAALGGLSLLGSKSSHSIIHHLAAELATRYAAGWACIYRDIDGEWRSEWTAFPAMCAPHLVCLFVPLGGGQDGEPDPG